jgi:hypothetical protein
MMFKGRRCSPPLNRVGAEAFVEVEAGAVGPALLSTSTDIFASDG